MIGYRLEDDLLKNIRSDSRMEKFCTRLLRASCSDPVGPVDLSLGTWRWTTLDVDWMWAVVAIAPVPFCGDIRSAFNIYGTASWFVGLVPRNPEFVELILLELEGFRVDPSETWRFPDADELLCKATVLLRPWAWRLWVDMISCDLGPRLGLAFSGCHSMTRRLVLNLLCHGHVDGIC
ncbi:hypothetical protein F2Q69_00005348 [Brassica cretica]|uniref:Uncharacterized protein n=1 Tax=Brassica cretica TaxID=69181 RepID=A0A8S9PIZ5_BRACR|nr:hypothetical protein F2Q69_00005348 [Brassica cretica]